MKGSTIREKIFEAYSVNLKNVTDGYKIEIGVNHGNGTEVIDRPVYICPLCIRAFSIESIDQQEFNPLTIEDLPPKSVGGNPKILTCKECNNKAGHTYDILILDSLKTEAFIRRIPNSTIRSTISMNKGPRFKLITQITKSKGFKFILRTKNNPKAEESLQDLIKNWNESKINFSFQSPNNKKVAVSLARIGLLLSFFYFGNRILFEGNYQKIRHHVINPEKNELPHDGIIIFPNDFRPEIGVHLIKNPENFRTFLIVYKIEIETLSKYVGFPFPGPGTYGWARYCNIGKLSRDTKLKLTDVTSTEYIDNKMYIDAYERIYSEV